LAEERTKPAIPFAAKYRIIDFTLSNCVNSGIFNVAVLTQYQPLSLADHLGIGASWGLVRVDGGGIRILQPYLAPDEGRSWYKGTADAVYQNLHYIDEQDADLVLILSGDHIYSMDYSEMIGYHRSVEADVTLAVTPFPEEELERFGTVMIGEEGEVTGFQEKVKEPESNLVSMGIYVFRKDALRHWLEEDARRASSRHDFGRNILPRIAASSGKTFAYGFGGYWRDVGTLDTYWQANMELLEMSPCPLFSADWPIRTKEELRPPVIVSPSGDVINSMISNGCVIEGRVEHSVLSPGVMVAEGAIVRDSIVMSDSIIGPHSVVEYSIVDKDVVVETGSHVGFSDNFQANRKQPKLLNTGLTVLGKRAKLPPGVRIGRNCIIGCGVAEEDFPGSEIESGQTVRPKRRRAA